MTAHPLTYSEICQLGLAIVKRHILNHDEPAFCFVHPSDFRLLGEMIEAGTIKMNPCRIINSKSRYNMNLKAALKEYQLPYSETGHRAIHTRNAFMSMLKEDMNKTMLQKLFERAVKNSFNNLVSIEASIGSDNQAALVRQSTEIYSLPEDFKSIYKDLTTAKDDEISSYCDDN